MSTLSLHRGIISKYTRNDPTKPLEPEWDGLFTKQLKPSNWAFTWWNTYNFQQDVFLVYLEADEMDLETTTCWNQPPHLWLQTHVACTDETSNQAFHWYVHDLVLQFQVDAFHVQEGSGQAQKTISRRTNARCVPYHFDWKKAWSRDSVLPLSQIIRRFDISRFITFTMYLHIIYI